MLTKAVCLPILVASLCWGAVAQQREAFIPFINSEHAWVDSVFRTLTDRDKVAQLFMVRAHSNLGQRYIDSVAGVVQREQLGGIVLFQGGPIRHAQVINRYQQLSKVPLLVAFDGEWGLSMRLADSTISFPYQRALEIGRASSRERVCQYV